MKLKEYESSFSFNDYLITKSVFELNTDFNPADSKAVEIDFKLDAGFNLSEDKDSAIVSLSCVVFEEFKKRNLPFYIYVEIVGDFSLHGDFSSEELVNFCRVNATAILFPYLRAFISQLSSQSGVPHLLLPTINVHRFLEKD